MKKTIGLLAMFVITTAVCGAQGTTFESWANYLITSTLTSPATAQSGDIAATWSAPNGQTVNLVAKIPHPVGGTLDLSGVPTYWPYTAGTDARPLFDAAIALVKSGGYGTLTIPTGTYTFLTNEPNGKGQWSISGLNNVVIEGTGNVKLVFTHTIDGIYMTQDIGVSLKDITIQYDPGRNMTYVAQVTQVGSKYDLVIPPTTPYTTYRKYALSSADAHIAKMLPFNTAYALSGGPTPYVPGGGLQPNGSAYPTFSLGTTSWDSAPGGGVTNTGFTASMVGIYYIVFEDSAGNAINVKDDRSSGALQSQDLEFFNVTINSAPTFGIGVLGVARGLIVSASHIVPGTSSVVSTNYDAIHVAQAGGDVYVEGNTIAQEGDDGINLSFPPQFSYSYTTVTDPNTGAQEAQIGLANFARLILPNDTLSFFDRENNYLGSQTVLSTAAVNPCPTITVPSGTSSYNANLAAYGYNPCATVTLTGLIPGFTTQTGFGNLYVRDDNIIGGRMLVLSNTIENCACHGVLEQNPNAKVQSNTFNNLARNAIRVLSNLGSYYTFQEGVGAINVGVYLNTINGTGTDADFPGSPSVNSYGAISSIGVWANGYLPGALNSGVSSNMVNYYVNIENNTVNNANQDCIFVNSTELGNVTSNTCNNTNLAAVSPSLNSILIYYSNPGTLGSSVAGTPGANTLTGSTTGLIVQNHANYAAPTN